MGPAPFRCPGRVPMLWSGPGFAESRSGNVPFRFTLTRSEQSAAGFPPGNPSVRAYRRYLDRVKTLWHQRIHVRRSPKLCCKCGKTPDSLQERREFWQSSTIFSPEPIFGGTMLSGFGKPALRSRKPAQTEQDACFQMAQSVYAVKDPIHIRPFCV